MDDYLLVWHTMKVEIFNVSGFTLSYTKTRHAAGVNDINIIVKMYYAG